jgi:Putative transposase
LGAKIGITSLLHTWGSTMTHPQVHMIVTGGGISPDGSRWINAGPAATVRVESPVMGPASETHHMGRRTITQAESTGSLPLYPQQRNRVAGSWANGAVCQELP